MTTLKNYAEVDRHRGQKLFMSIIAELRSLLSCYEGEEAMALECEICEGQARLAYRLHRKGRSLDQIRAAIDARYGA